MTEKEFFNSKLFLKLKTGEGLIDEQRNSSTDEYSCFYSPPLERRLPFAKHCAGNYPSPVLKIEISKIKTGEGLIDDLPANSRVITVAI